MVTLKMTEDYDNIDREEEYLAWLDSLTEEELEEELNKLLEDISNGTP